MVSGFFSPYFSPQLDTRDPGQPVRQHLPEGASHLNVWRITVRA
jgi:hypothetical protein